MENGGAPSKLRSRFEHLLQRCSYLLQCIYCSGCIYCKKPLHVFTFSERRSVAYHNAATHSVCSLHCKKGNRRYRGTFLCSCSYAMRKETKSMRRAAQMPPLAHAMPGQSFDWQQSEVAAWLTQQPEILDALLEYYKRTGAIVFDKSSGKWRGKSHGVIDTSL